MHFPLQPHVVVQAALAVFETVSLLCIPLVLVRRKEPATTFAWILMLIFLPVAGVVLFWFLGRDRVRRPVRELAEAKKEWAEGSIPPLAPNMENYIDEQPIEQRGVMRLAARMRQGRVLGGNAVEILVDAPSTYESILEQIDGARRYIYLEYYIFRLDKQGAAFLKALTRAAERGVQVRILADAFGSRSLKGPLVKQLTEAGGQVAFFFPIEIFKRPWTINLRNHRKIVVIDGEIAFTGGINIGEEFLKWHDIHLKMHGPAAQELEATFLEDWQFARRRAVPTQPRPRISNAPHGAIVQMVDSGPDATIQSIHRLYFAAIASARDRVYITTPYFVPDRAILMALQTAALRGVDVRLILPGKSNHLVTFHAGRAYYDELLEAGVLIHEYLPGMMHTKTMVIDGRFATVGSANLDVRSFRLNFETIAVLYDSTTVGRLERIFLDDLGKTKLVELDEWRTRPYATRIKEGFGRLCSPLL